jgi:hypothetical protein
MQLFSEDMLSVLRHNYTLAGKLDPTSPTLQKIVTLLDKMDSARLLQLAEANISHLSPLAQKAFVKKLNS